MEDQIISYETAKLAKEKSFDIPTENVYVEDEHGYMYLDQRDWYLSDHWEDQYLVMDKVFPAPTQSLLQKWLREEHGVHISIEPDMLFGADDVIKVVYNCRVYSSQTSGWINSRKYKQYSESYHEALEWGLIEGLNLIK